MTVTNWTVVVKKLCPSQGYIDCNILGGYYQHYSTRELWVGPLGHTTTICTLYLNLHYWPIIVKCWFCHHDRKGSTSHCPASSFDHLVQGIIVLSLCSGAL